MAYKQSPVKVMKGQMTNKAAGLAHGDSMAMQLKDPKTGKRKVQPFKDPGPDPSQGFTNDMEKGLYDEEEPSRKYFGAQKQLLNALDLARRQLGGEEAMNKMVKGGYSSLSLTGPQAAQIITGYSSGDKGKETVGGQGKVRFNKEAVERKLNELDSLAKKDPVGTRSYISNRISGAPLGDFAKKFERDVDPLKRNN
jgi:hypothetical protein